VHAGTVRHTTQTHGLTDSRRRAQAIGLPHSSPKIAMPRYIASILACFFIAIAVAGVVVPGLPTVPFLLLAAWFSARGSERLHKWLYAHPHLGRLLIDWETQKAISRRSKVIAVLMMLASWVVMYQHIDSPWMLAGITLLFISVGAYLVSRREPG
jgi:uncharacterized protein